MSVTEKSTSSPSLGELPPSSSMSATATFAPAPERAHDRGADQRRAAGDDRRLALEPPHASRFASTASAVLTAEIPVAKSAVRTGMRRERPASAAEVVSDACTTTASFSALRRTSGTGLTRSAPAAPCGSRTCA